MALIGRAQSAKIFVPILRMRVAAVWLRLAGVGCWVLQQPQQMVANSANVGMQNSGVRQLASTRQAGTILC